MRGTNKCKFGCGGRVFSVVYLFVSVCLCLCLAVRVFDCLTCCADGSGAEGGAEGGVEEVEIRRAGLALFMLLDSCA